MDLRGKNIYKATLTGTAVNAALIILKLTAGIAARSAALVADAVHSLSDFMTDFIVLIFVRIAGKPRDKGHDYGHGKFETLATMIIGFVLIGAGVGLWTNGIDLVGRSLGGEVLPRPGFPALAVALVSIIAKEWLYRYTVMIGREVNSQAVIANAWHHRSDALSSGGTLAGIAGAMFLDDRWRILDPVAAILVSIFIIKSGYDIIRPAIAELLEASLPEEQEKVIVRIVGSVEGIDSLRNLRTRRIGNGIAVDIHARMDGSLSLHEAHAIASHAEEAIKKHFGPNSIVYIHMEPSVGN